MKTSRKLRVADLKRSNSDGSSLIHLKALTLYVTDIIEIHKEVSLVLQLIHPQPMLQYTAKRKQNKAPILNNAFYYLLSEINSLLIGIPLKSPQSPQV